MLARIKELEHRGYQFEAADGSLELLLRRESGGYDAALPARVLARDRREARRRRRSRPRRRSRSGSTASGACSTAEGNGPVNALDSALRAAIGEVHPHLADIELVNFKVRILDEDKGTGAVTRVLLDSSDGTEVWGSIGVSENVVAASWEALVDSLERGMLSGPPA